MALSENMLWMRLDEKAKFHPITSYEGPEGE
jgi:hypothetical protein